MSTINQNSVFLNVSENITKYILIVLSKFKAILPSNLLRLNQNYLFNIFDNHLIHYNSPISLTYAWSFGSLAGICLIIQMISGIFLAMNYTPHVDLAFNSVEYIMRDVNNG